MQNGVATITSLSVEQWMQAIKLHYGETYYQQVLAYFTGGNEQIWTYSVNEYHIYGSSRLGLITENKLLAHQPVYAGQTNYVTEQGDSSVLYSYANDSIKTFYRGQKRYELSNHLGNVLAVITDRRIQACGADMVMYYNAQTVSVSDYYPFGMQVKDRSWSDSSFSYRFAFNGKEHDDEVSGEGNSYDYGFRIYNPRLGKFLSVDPLGSSYPWNSKYAYAENDVISSIDLDGLERLNKTVTSEPNASTGIPGQVELEIAIDYIVVTDGTDAVENTGLINPSNVARIASRGNSVLYMTTLPSPTEEPVLLSGESLRLVNKMNAAKSEKKKAKYQQQIADMQLEYYAVNVTYNVNVTIDPGVTLEDARNTQSRAATGQVGIIYTPSNSDQRDFFTLHPGDAEGSLGGGNGNVIQLSHLWYGANNTSADFNFMMRDEESYEQLEEGSYFTEEKQVMFASPDDIIVHGFGHNSGAVLNHTELKNKYHKRGLQSNVRDRVWPSPLNTEVILRDNINRTNMTTQ